MSKDYQYAFISRYQVLDIEVDTNHEFYVTKTHNYDFQVEHEVTITMLQSNFTRLIKDFSEADRERIRRERCPAAQAAYERYRQLLELIPDNANT